MNKSNLDPTSSKFVTIDPTTKKIAGEWAVLVTAGNLLLISDYAAATVERLKQIIPPGARRFYRNVSADFLAAYGFNPPQSEWLVESRLFNGLWELLYDYRRPLLDALTLEHSEVWTVEQSQVERLTARAPHSSPQPPIDPEKFGLGPSVEVLLSWAKSYSLYCHRHRQFEVRPCPDAGVLVTLPKPAKSQTATSAESSGQADLNPTLLSNLVHTKDGRPASFVAKAPLHTLVRARRQQTSYYMLDKDDIVRLGRDEAGAAIAHSVIESQRLALVIRAAQSMHLYKQTDGYGF